MSTQMGAGRDLDAEVARALGWRVEGATKHGAWITQRPDGSWVGLADCRFSTDIAAAWQVVEKMHDLGWVVVVRRAPDCVIAEAYQTQGRTVITRSMVGEHADTAPLAISRAALAALLPLYREQAMSAQQAAPDRIWLQDGCTCGMEECVCDPSEDAYDGDVTWCRDRINRGDTEYLRATPEREAAADLLAVLKACERWILNDAAPIGWDMDRLRAAIRAATGGDNG